MTHQPHNPIYKPAYKLMEVDETTSTNNQLIAYCQEHQDQVPDLTTLRAAFQSAGKGQKGNSWESEAGSNLLFSTVFYPSNLPARSQFIISQALSLCIKEELEQHTDHIAIKWPNDIYWNDKKICGILIEVFLEGAMLGRCICGVGLNLNQKTFVSNAPNPISLTQITGKRHRPNDVLDGIMQRLQIYLDKLKKDPEGASEIIRSRYSESLYRRNGMHRYADKNGTFMAHLLRVEPDGQFILLDEQGNERSYLFKEVQHII